jgi:hypothetical protein
MPNISRPNLEEDAWELASAEERHAQYPDSFSIPSREERESLKRGDWVQLLFLLRGEKKGKTFVQCEKMWVNIHEVRSGEYRGNLESKPATSQVLRPGSNVTFEPQHVCTVMILKTDPRHPDYAAFASLLTQEKSDPGPFYHGRPLSHWSRCLKSSQSEIRGSGFDALRGIGPEGVAAIPVLMELLADEIYTSATAAQLLGQIGPSAISVLLPALHSSEVGVRWGAVHALGEIGPPAKEAIPIIKQLVGDEDTEVCQAAMKALDKISGRK